MGWDGVGMEVGGLGDESQALVLLKDNKVLYNIKNNKTIWGLGGAIFESKTLSSY